MNETLGAVGFGIIRDIAAAKVRMEAEALQRGLEVDFEFLAGFLYMGQTIGALTEAEVEESLDHITSLMCSPKPSTSWWKRRVT